MAGVVVPQRPPFQRRLAALLVADVLKLLIKSWRLHWQKAETYPGTIGPVIFCVWHNRLPAALASYHFITARWPVKGLAAVTSASRDGGFLATIVERFNIQAVRGSSSRRGAVALLESSTWLEREFSVVFTPDGPRGPVYKIKPGIIKLAQLTGRPIIPTCSHTPWKIRLRSWDRFQIPLPFSRCETYHSDPIWVPRDASKEHREQIRLKLETAMLAITKD